jgi:hypothetical protein
MQKTVIGRQRMWGERARARVARKAPVLLKQVAKKFLNRSFVNHGSK